MQWLFEFTSKRLTRLEQEFLDRVSGYFIAALGLIAGLAWNDAVKSLIEYVFPLKQNSVPAKFLYAVLMTLFVATITLIVLKLIKPSKSSSSK